MVIIRIPLNRALITPITILLTMSLEPLSLIIRVEAHREGLEIRVRLHLGIFLEQTTHPWGSVSGKPKPPRLSQTYQPRNKNTDSYIIWSKPRLGWGLQQTLSTLNPIETLECPVFYWNPYTPTTQNNLNIYIASTNPAKTASTKSAFGLRTWNNTQLETLHTSLYRA